MTARRDTRRAGGESRTAYTRRWLLETLLASGRPLTSTDLERAARRTASRRAVDPDGLRARRTELARSGLIAECGRAVEDGAEVTAWCITWDGVRAVSHHYT